MAADVEGGPLKFFLTRRGAVVVGIVVVLALFLVRPGAQRLRTRIVRSVGLALGRQVDVGSVTVRLLPQPGFELENFVVHDDPEFGAEPVLQSSDVVALVRVSSLLRGRLEISRLSLSEPSLNLVRNAEGRWNLENLLERAAKTPVAPTSKTRSEVRPGFPYIEADHGRINFKSGPEKKPYSLTEASFALWQDSENAWGVRLKAQPMRTDANLSDTGLLAVQGSWERAVNLHQMPLQFTVQWEGAQLGQVTKLTLGQDKGWRGGIEFTASLTGTPEDLTVATDTTVQDFHRYDIASDKALRLAAHCGGHYSSADHVVSKIACRGPVGDGVIAVDGSVALLSASPAYNLTVLARKVPVQPLVELARRMKKNVPPGIVATGKLDADVAVQRDANSIGPAWDGGGAFVGLNVRSPVNNTRLSLERVPFVVSSHNDLASTVTSKRGQTRRILAVVPHIDVGPFSLALGRQTAAIVHGQFSHSGYALAVDGDAEVQRLLDIARTAGLPAPQMAANGEAHISLRVGGSWADFAPPAVTGTAQLNSIHARLRGLRDPVEITSANLSLTPDATEVRKLTLVAVGNTWRGSMTLPRKCATPHSCPIHFDLFADEINAAALATSGPVPGKQPWYRFLSSAQSSPVQSSSAQPGSSQTGSGQYVSSQLWPYLASVHAVGKLSAGRVLIRNVLASRVSADVELEQGRLQVTNLQGDILGGRHRGDWTADFTANPPAFGGKGELENVALGQLAEAMHDAWITGTADLEYRASTSGWSKAELLSQATGSFQAEARDGSMPHLILDGDAGPLRVNKLWGRLRLRDGKFEIEEGKLQTPSSIYQVSGTASLNRDLDVKLTRDGARGFNVTGTLTQPHVVMSTNPDTQAALKP